MDVTWNGGRSVRVTGRGVSLDLDGSVQLGDGRTFGRPGEYDVQGLPIVGVQSRAGAAMNTVFSVYLEDVALCHVGALSEPLTAEQVDAIGRVDVLFLPLGSGPDPAELIGALDPKIVVPLAQDPAAVEAFGRQVGETAPVARLTIAADKLPDARRVVTLTPPKAPAGAKRKAA